MDDLPFMAVLHSGQDLPELASGGLLWHPTESGNVICNNEFVFKGLF